MSATTLIGRDTEIDQLESWLLKDEHRLVTIAGPGGIGKTRLAAELQEQWPDASHWIPLDDAHLSGASVMSRIGQTLELPECPRPEWHSRLDTLLRSPTLLVLDCFEQVRDQAPAVAELLKLHPQISVVVTSRAPLLLSQERLLTLEPLNLNESVKLLMTRAQAVRPDLEVSAQNKTLVENLCRRLDGIPLALELAAARLRHLGLQELEKGLQESIELLSGGGPDRPDRQKTLAATLEWSSQLLTDSERELLARLAVFRGSFDKQAASALSPGPVITELLNLADQSLIVTRHTAQGETRYALLDTVRTWVTNTLTRPTGLKLSHAEYYLKLAESNAGCRGGEEHAAGLKRLSREKGNLRAALQAFQGEKLWSQALRLVGSLGWYWEACSLLTEGEEALTSALQGGLENEESAAAHYWLGVLLRHHGNYSRAQQHAEKALAQFKNPERRAFALCSLGQLAFRQGEYTESETYFQKALEVAEEASFSEGRMRALNGLGRTAWMKKQVSEGIEFEHQSLQIAQLEKFPLGEAWAHNALGEIHRNLQEPRAAALHFKRAAERFGQLHEFSLAALALQNLAYVELGLRRWDAAQSGFQEALGLWRKAGARHGLALCLIGLAGVLAGLRRDQLGARFLGAADALLESIGVRLEASDSQDYSHIQGSLRTRLSTQFKEEHWTGRQTGLDELLALLQESEAEPSPEGLTPRETEVLKATATGASNKEVAEMLVISPQTVMVHLRSIYRKLNVTSRTAASRWAVENGLVLTESPGTPTKN